MKQAVAILSVLLFAGLAQAEEVLVIVSEADCRWLSVHEPAPDVTYTPGRDVRGRPVVPADLPGSPRIDIAGRIPIALEIPLAVFLREATPPLLDDAKIDAGTVTIDRRSGEVFYNDAPVSDPGRAHLVAACKAKRRSGRD